MILNAERGRRVKAKPNLDHYDNLQPKFVGVDPHHDGAATGKAEYKNTLILEKEYPSTWARDKALLVKLGVNGEVPLVDAVKNASLVFCGGALDGKGKSTAWFATQAANDNEQSRMAA